ncbi:MAG TPA: DUF2062 domain-containing protein [Alphaproteobacteria bacterium]|nr:DUF2062 domain-containing protein [Alphaproteobacteria bacterium]
MAVTERNRRQSRAGSLKSGIWNRLRRLLRLRLVIPVMRARHSPDYTARGVLVGVVIAMTPTVGVQMPLVGVCWLLARFLRPAWGFNVVSAMAWTWVTNIFTLAPFYYLFLVTGQFMMGRWGQPANYHVFSQRLAEVLSKDASLLDSVWIYAVQIFSTWGEPMFIGSIPWAILSGWVGYRWSLSLSRSMHLRREQRRKSRTRQEREG